MLGAHAPRAHLALLRQSTAVVCFLLGGCPRLPAAARVVQAVRGLEEATGGAGEALLWLRDDMAFLEPAQVEALQAVAAGAPEVRAARPALGLDGCSRRGCERVESEAERFQRCSQCKVAKYCCRQCQGDDWRAHKAVCPHVREAVGVCEAQATEV